MPIYHSPDNVELEPAELGDHELYLIGRLVRACALLEDACHNYLGYVVKVTPATLTLLIPKLGISSKLPMAGNFAALRGKEEQASFANHFDVNKIVETLKCRNAVVHGHILGRSRDGKWAFETTMVDPKSESENVASVTVMSFRTKDIELYAEWAEDLAKNAGSHPFVLEQRKERRWTALQPSKKSQPKRQPSAKPGHQPQSSEE